MSQRGALLVIFFTAIALITFPSRSEAGKSAAGCYDCHYSFVWGDPFSEDAECVQVANNSSGDGIYCRTYYTGMAKDCETSGGACYYIEVTGSSVSPHPKPHTKKAHTAVVQLF